ncbi:MAG: hypothetical protein OQK82_01300, partial [Candidatus Pacearchaeota archaeon]|nr:hypothetical protein [Candidatus Pacearchaeota archaeon]
MPRIGEVLNDHKNAFLKNDTFKNLIISASAGLINKYSIDFSKEEWTGKGEKITRIPNDSEMMQYVDNWRMGLYLNIESH